MSKFSEKSAKISKFLKIFLEFFEKNTKIWGQSSVKFWEKSFPKIHKFFFKFPQKFLSEKFTWQSKSDAQYRRFSKNLRKVFLQPEIVFGSWRIFAKEFFWSQKFRNFWLFSKKFLCCEALFLKQKKKPSAFFMSCRLSILSALAELDKKISLREKFFLPNDLSGMGFEIWKPKENLLAIIGGSWVRHRWIILRRVD